MGFLGFKTSKSHSVDSRATMHQEMAKGDNSTTGPGDTSDAEKAFTKHDDTSPDMAKGKPQIDRAVEKRLLRKLDRHVPWLVAFLFLLSFLDRSNIGNANIAGMDVDLNLIGNDHYDWLLTVFYIAYILFQFQAFMWKIVKPHYWCSFIVLAWGILATAQAAAQNWQGMMALRFLLGASEAGFGPSVPFLLSFFYLRHEIGFRCGFFLSAAPLASTFAGALAYGITSGHSKLANWRLLFLVEGLPTLFAAVLAFFYLPDGPSTAKFLTEEERQVARLRVAKMHGKKEVDTVQSKVSLKEIGQTLLDAKSWFVALMYFSCNVSYASLPVFLPRVLKDMGFTGTAAQGLTAPPYFLSFLITCGTTWIADRTQQRGLMIVGLSIVGGVGYVMLATLKGVGGRYAGVFLAAGGVYPCIANILPWVINNQGSSTRRGMGIVILNLVGQCGPLLGTRIYPASAAPRYVKGQSIAAAFMFFNGILAISLRTLLTWENKQLDKKYGVPNNNPDATTDLEDEDGTENYGRNFRFVL